MADPRITNADSHYWDVLVLRPSGSVKRYGQRVQNLARPGVDGEDFALVGLRADAFRIRIFRDCTSASEARQLEIDWNALAGTLIKYKDSDGATWDDVMVLGIVCRRQWLGWSSGYFRSGGADKSMVVADLRLKLSSEPTTEPP